MRRFKAAELDGGVRTDVFVAAKYPDFSRSSLDKLFEQGSIKVSGKPTKPGYKLKIGDKLSVDEELLFKEPATIQLPVIYEDDDVIVIDKPTGILTHSKGALNLEPTVASFIKPKITDKTLIGNRAGIVHRLDRGTSGVIIAAKHDKALKWLQGQFSARKAKKTYIAVAEGELEPTEAIIEAPIIRNPKKPQTFTASPVGKPSETEYKVQRSFRLGDKDYSLVKLKPRTGRTHQLRVHLSYIKHPVVGDHLYGHDGRPMLLHAQSLELTLPSKERRIFEAPLPARFKEFEDG